MNLPHSYAFGTYNDIQATRRVVTPDIGTIIVEPLQGAGGLIPATTGFLQYLRTTADEIGAVLIFDEVVTSRLHYGGLQGHHNIYPDMTTLGKYVGGGFPFGAFGGRKEIMQRLDPRISRANGGIPHSGTYNNNTFSMNAGLAVARALTPQHIDRCNAFGDSVRDGMHRMITDHKAEETIRVTGWGSLCGILFVGDEAEARRDAFFFWMLKKGIYVGRRGFLNFGLAHESRHVDQVLTAFKQFLELM